MAVAADVLQQPEARHLGRCDGRLHHEVRSAVPGVDLWRQRAIHLHRLCDRGPVRSTSFFGRSTPAHVGAIGGRIKNDYDDFLGSGQPLKSEDNIRSIFARYLYRVRDDWFIGVQALSTNYQIVGQTSLDDDKLDILGLTGFESSGAGLVVQHDSRDALDSPKKGWLLNLNNAAYRERRQVRHIQARLPALLEPWRRPCLRVSSEQPVDARRTPVGLCAGAVAGLHLGGVPGQVHVLHRSRRAPSFRRALDGHALRGRCLPVRRRSGRLFEIRQPLPHRGRAACSTSSNRPKASWPTWRPRWERTATRR